MNSTNMICFCVWLLHQQTIASATMMSTLSVMGVTVRDMKFFNSAFSVEDSGSMLILKESLIMNNQNENGWNGVSVDDSAVAVIEGTTFSGNEQFEALVRAQSSAQVSLSDCTFEANVGRFPEAMSTGVYASMNSDVIVSRTTFAANRLHTVSTIMRRPLGVATTSCAHSWCH